MNLSAIPVGSSLGKVLRWPLRWLPQEMVVPIVQGPAKGYRWIIGAGNHGCWLGTYEFDKQQVFTSKVPKGGVVFDVGANVGFYTLLAAEVVGPSGAVAAFEPLARNLGYLRRHVELNSLTNVKVIAAAVSDKEGEAFFDPANGPSMGHLASEGPIRVQTVTLDELVFTNELPRPDLLKIDVEGAEEAVLCGSERLLTEAQPTVFLATHSDKLRERCISRLHRRGYIVRSVSGTAIEASDEFIAEPAC